MIGEPAFFDKPELCQRAIKCRDIMPLGQEQNVAVRVVPGASLKLEEALVKRDEEVRAGKGGSEKASAVRREPDDAFADAKGEPLPGLPARRHAASDAATSAAVIVRSS